MGREQGPQGGLEPDGTEGVGEGEWMKEKREWLVQIFEGKASEFKIQNWKLKEINVLNVINGVILNFDFLTFILLTLI